MMSQRRFYRWSDFGRLALSAGVSGGVLWLLLRLTQAGGGEAMMPVLHRAWRHLPLGAMLGYVIAQLVQGWARAVRYRLLLRAGKHGMAPSLGAMLVVTFVRNMLVDMLPARVGEFIYVGMLKTGHRIRSEAGLAGMGVSILLDLMALAAVLLVCIGSLRGSAVGVWVTLAALTLAVAIGWGLVFHAAQPVVGAWRRLAGDEPRPRLHAAALDFAARLADELTALRRGGALVEAMGWTVLIRVAKYGGLLALFYGVTHVVWPELHGAPPGMLLIGLIAAEGAAALPAPTFMAFGAYEAGGVGALTLLGASPADTALAMLALHVVAQAVDYTFGGMAWIIFIFSVRRAPPDLSRRRGANASSRRRRNFRLIPLIFLLVVGAVGAVGLVAAYRARRRGASTPPPVGEARLPEIDVAAAVRSLVGDRQGVVVWSSNRFGNHDIVRRNLPGGNVERLTRHPHVDTYPRLSPCGGWAVFCRSHREWVSQRDPVPWDVYLLDLNTGRERLLARNGFTPNWTADGAAVVFVRNGDQVVLLRVEDDQETVLHRAGANGLPSGVIFQTPDYDADGDRLAVTLRGAVRATAVLQSGRTPRLIGGGCQLNWSPERDWLYFVETGRGRANVMQRVDATGAMRAWFAPVSPFQRAYFPRLSPGGGYMVYGAAAAGHEHDTADYEIFLWRVGDDPDRAVRLTWHTGNDGWPDLWLAPAAGE